MESHFEVFPVELQTHILLTDYGPETGAFLRAVRQVCRLWQVITQTAYIKWICRQSLTMKEIQGYLARAPQLFGYFTRWVSSTPSQPFHEEFTIHCWTDLSMDTERPLYTRLRSLVSYYDFGVNDLSIRWRLSFHDHGHSTDRSILDELAEVNFELDLLTIARILWIRLGVFTHDHEVARQIHQDYMHQHLTALLASWNVTHPYDLLTVYMYLMGTARIMNLLPISSPSRQSYSIQFAAPDHYPTESTDRDYKFLEALRPKPGYQVVLADYRHQVNVLTTQIRTYLSYRQT